MPNDQLATQSPKADIRVSVRGFEQFYEVDASGNVYRLWRITSDGRTLQPRKLKPILRSKYWYVELRGVVGEQRSAGMHQIVCEAFHGLAPSLKHEPNHKDGNKANNAADNLEWMTRSENQRHAADIGLKPHGEASHLAKLSLTDVRTIRALLGSRRFSQREIAIRFRVRQSQISRIATGKKWRNDQ